jgi:hypothetical protein
MNYKSWGNVIVIILSSKSDDKIPILIFTLFLNTVCNVTLILWDHDVERH